MRLKWVTVQPGQVIMDEANDDAVVWSYQCGAMMNSRTTVNEEDNSNGKIYVAGENGATLLRMDLTQLRLSTIQPTNFGRLAFESMQNKLKALRMVSPN